MKNLSNVKNILWILAGNTAYAMAVTMFILPNGLITGGTTGLALFFYHQFGLPIQAFVTVFNVAMFLVGAWVLGKRFALTTIISTFYYPFILSVFQRIPALGQMTRDNLLAVIFAGLLIGGGIGVVIRAGASTGGMDIPPLVLNHYFRIPVSLSLYVFDFCILLTQAFWSTQEKLLYGIVLVMTYTIVLDKLMLMGTARTEVKVVTRYHQQVRDAILQKLDRGVTLFYGEGGYLHQETQVVFSIISNRELPQAEKLIRSIDPESFMVVSRVSEVRGRGFSMSKKYQ